MTIELQWSLMYKMVPKKTANGQLAIVGLNRYTWQGGVEICLNVVGCFVNDFVANLLSSHVNRVATLPCEIFGAFFTSSGQWFGFYCATLDLCWFLVAVSSSCGHWLHVLLSILSSLLLIWWWWWWWWDIIDLCPGFTMDSSL